MAGIVAGIGWGRCVVRDRQVNDDDELCAGWLGNGNIVGVAE